MKKPEQNLWQAMKRNLRRQFILERVENIVADGMPDVHGIRAGVEFWVELKVARSTKRAYSKALTKYDIRPSQVNWHHRFIENGGRSYVLVKLREQAVLVSGNFIGKLIDATPQQIIDMSVAVGWGEIVEALKQ